MTARVRTAGGFAALVAAAACSSGGGNAGGGAENCSEATRVGSFTLDLKPELNGAPPYAQFNGLVRDGVDPADVWDEIARAGSCRVVVGPTAGCAPACGAGMACRAGACVAAPVAHSVGMVTITGLVVPLAVTPNSTTASYYGPIPTGTAYPPYTLGATVALDAEGGAGDFVAFRLVARGIEPLELPENQTLALATSAANAPLTLRWTPATAGAAGRMHISLDIAHHAGIAAELRCELPDNGMATLPGPLLDALVARGTAGFPEIVFSRLSADKTTLAPGCVDFAVASSVARQLTVEGVTSCTQDSDCTAPQICKPELKCG